MKAKFNESMSSVYVNYKTVSLHKDYTIDVVEFDAEVSIVTGFEIDCQVALQVAVESDKGTIVLEGQKWFSNIGAFSQNQHSTIEMKELSVINSRVKDEDLEQFLEDIADSVVSISYSTI